MTTKLLNGLPLGALPEGSECFSWPITGQEASLILVDSGLAETGGKGSRARLVQDHARRLDPEVQSYVGHADTAACLSAYLHAEIPCNRADARLQIGDRIVVAALTGPRLPAGATTLPDGASFRWFRVEIRPAGARSTERDAADAVRRAAERLMREGECLAQRLMSRDLLPDWQRKAWVETQEAVQRAAGIPPDEDD